MSDNIEMVQLIRAKWLKHDAVKYDDVWFCSNCHHVRTGYPTRYCPHCGALMEDKK